MTTRSATDAEIIAAYGAYSTVDYIIPGAPRRGHSRPYIVDGKLMVKRHGRLVETSATMWTVNDDSEPVAIALTANSH
jgi:hypothetical protein